MKLKSTYCICIFIFLIHLCCLGQEIAVSKNNQLPLWQEGYLDIHHINTGNGDACFMVLPDGTTLLFDAGIINKEKFEAKYKPLKATATIPNDSLSAAQWIARYIHHFSPNSKKAILNYALVSHFHSDHYGSLTALGTLLPIKKIIDRNAPKYDYPLNLRGYLKNDTLFQNYLSFINDNKIQTEALKVGYSNQITLLNKPNAFLNFKVQNIKSGATLWSGFANNTIALFSAKDMADYYNGKYNENPLSLAIKISYGKFDYFTGGDNTGLQGFGLPKWFDVETPMAKVVGQVEVSTLNHHGNRDATNANFINTLNPQVAVQQSWCSDHPGQEVYQRLLYTKNATQKRAIYATYIHPETKVTYGPWFVTGYESTSGHVVVRVYAKGEKYTVYVLDEKSLLIKQQKTYFSR